MRTDNARAMIEAYRRNYSPSFQSFLKRLTGYLAAAAVIYLYGREETALLVLLALLVVDVLLTAGLSRES
ncbi:hypothetical protein FH039_07195 [Thermococcus indicus]|uniref:Uncharacterized protein n=1 Tax=Thermococcus indicus TaxID=2586643 RepID=A0A4Y5SMK6_9EURY|nr:hypothetical protein [Thermococcus indicus]QDA31429.1 hypothetical protein FH039_07195 [Thermococcus indicus]